MSKNSYKQIKFVATSQSFFMLSCLLPEIPVKEKLGKFNTVISYACFHIEAQCDS